MGMAKLLLYGVFLALVFSLAIPPAGQPEDVRTLDVSPPMTRASDGGAPPEPAGHTAGFWDTSEYLIGSVAVAVFFVESDGSTEVQTENWTAGDLATAQSEITDALSWWATVEPNASVSFMPAFEVVNVSVEPINHVCGQNATGTWVCEESLWVNETMAQKGYVSGTPSNRVRAYLNATRAAQGTDWAFAMFVLNSEADGDGMFVPPPGGNATWALGYFGGPWLLMTRDNGAWGLGNMSEVAAHEMGHIFYATDEYDGITESSGYLNAPDIENSGCLMETDLRTCLSNGTRNQIGWRDADADGVPEPVDVEPNTTLTATPPATNPGINLTYLGTAVIPALPNLNPQDAGNDIQVADVVNISYRLDGAGPWLPATPSDGSLDSDDETFVFNVTAGTAGPHVVEVCSTSSFGILESTCAQHNFIVDLTLPSSQVAQPPFTYTTNPLIPLSASASDDVAIQSVELWRNFSGGGGWVLESTDFLAPYDFSFNAGPTGDGRYDFYSIALDSASNLEAPPVVPDASVILDRVAPTTTTNVVVPWYVSNLTVSFTRSEPGQTSFRVNGGNWVSGDSVYLSAEGLHILEFNSTDLAGNMEATKNVTVGIDRTRPTANLLPLPALTSNATVVLDWNASDFPSGILNVELYHKGPGLPGWTFLDRPVSPPYAWAVPNDGLWQFTTVAVDIAGWREDPPSTAEATTQLDTGRPVSTLQPLPPFHNSYQFDITANASDPDGISAVELWVRVNGGNFTLWDTLAGANVTFQVDASPVQGVYGFYSIAIDLAGNREAAPLTWSNTTVDLSAPVVIITAPDRVVASASWYLVGEVLVEWIPVTDPLSGVALTEIQLDASAWSDVGADTWRWLRLIPDGVHTIRLRSIDRAGNQGSDSVDIQVDATPPVLVISSPADNQTFAPGAVTVSWNASDPASGIARFTVTIASAEEDVGTARNWTSPSLEAGTYTVVVRAFDVAGGSTAANVTFVVPRPGGNPGGAPFNLWPAVFLLVVLAVAILLLLISRLRRKRPAFPDFAQMHPVEAESGLGRGVGQPAPEADEDVSERTSNRKGRPPAEAPSEERTRRDDTL